MRVCIAYDCLFPWTIGGGERWLRRLAEHLVQRGDDVTYITRRQWDEEDAPSLPGIRVIAVSPRDPLYSDDGRRGIAPPLRFGRGVLGHLLRNRHSYDVVHCAAFPYFSLLAARVALAGTRTRLFADWYEVWSKAYWREYLGGAKGWVGRIVQAACVQASPRAIAISPATARRLRSEGMRGPILTLPGLYDGRTSLRPRTQSAQPPTAVFAGRLIPEKRAHLIPGAIAHATGRIPGLRARIFGDGPERARVQAEIDRLGLGDRVEAPGFVAPDVLEAAVGSAVSSILPSSREGYGMVVVESSAMGTPTVVVAGEDNAAVDLVEPGVNGFVAPQATAAAIADALVAAHRGGDALRASTAGWFARNRERLDIEHACRVVAASYSVALDRS